jgi:hypothetical protein
MKTKRIFSIICAAAMAAGAQAFAQEAAQPSAPEAAEVSVKETVREAGKAPSNCLSFSVLDLLKLSVGSLAGDISYTRKLNDFDRLRFSIGGQVQSVREASQVYPNDIKTLRSYGAMLGVENLFVFDCGKVDPYLGLGLVGSLLWSESREFASNVENATTYSCGATIPLGIEFDASKSIKIGIAGAIGAYYSYSIHNNSVIGFVSAQETWEGRFSSLKIYFSFWF